MTVSDYTDVVVRFTDEVGAQVFAKFVALEGIPCASIETGFACRATALTNSAGSCS